MPTCSRSDFGRLPIPRPRQPGLGVFSSARQSPTGAPWVRKSLVESRSAASIWIHCEQRSLVMTIAFPPRLQALAICILAALVWGAGMMSAQAQSIVVMVNGDPITDYDIEQRTKLNFLSTHKQQSRQEILNELIDDKVKIKEGKKFGVE